MERRKKTNKKAHMSVMPNSQKRKNLPELQRNILTKRIIQNIIKHNNELD